MNRITISQRNRNYKKEPNRYSGLAIYRTVLKNSLVGFNSILKQAEERIVYWMIDI